MARECSEPGCQEPHTARGLCHRHYRAFLRHGGARVVQPARHYGKTPEERFWLYVDREGRGCWEWTGYKNAKGYGVINLRGERVLTHRMAYELEATIPDGMCVLHVCDNPACVRFKHLFLGTKADNNADMDAKGRGRRGLAQTGTGNHRARLTEADIRAIRTSSEAVTALATRYGVARGHIYGILKRRFWPHIE